MSEKQHACETVSKNIIEECCRTDRNEKYVVGQITAVSHLMKMVPISVRFVEVTCKKRVHHIAVPQQQLQNASSDLSYGQLWKFTQIQTKKLKYTEGSPVRLMVTSNETNFLNYPSIYTPLQCRYGLINVEGVITAEICAPLGLYELNNRVQLCLGLVVQYVKMQLPAVGRHVSVNNAHWYQRDGIQRLILCGRGSFHILDSGPKLKYDYYILKNLKCQLTYSHILWLKKQMQIFGRKFTDEFLSSHNVISDRKYDVRQRLLSRTVNELFPEASQGDRLLSKEFLCDPHQCIVTDEPNNIYADCQTVEELCNFKLQPHNSWTYHGKSIESGVVGILMVDPQYGYWMVCDATCRMPCLITGDMLYVAKLHGAVVLLTKCLLIVELFGNGACKRYFHVSAENIRIIQNPGLDSMEVTRVVGLIDSKVKTNSVIHGLSLLNNEVVPACRQSLIFLVLHKTNIMKYSRQPFSCLIVNLLGKPNQCDLLSTRETNMSLAERKKIVLQGKLIRYVPLLQINSVYMMTLSSDIFSSQERLKSKSTSIQNMTRIYVPEDTVFCSVNLRVPTSLIVNSDCYSIGAIFFQEELARKETINIKAVITDRLHCDVKYDSEKNVNAVHHYGVPDKKTIVLKLADPASWNKEIVPLYLNKWQSHAYPIGLLPGAHIRVSYVTMKQAIKSGSWYFHTTDITTIEVEYLAGSIMLNMPIDIGPTLENWGPDCILTQEGTRGTPRTMWGLLSYVKILKLKASVFCVKCNGRFKNMCCTGCDTYPTSPYMHISVLCGVDDVFGKILVYIKNEQLCDLFGLSEKCWKMITRLVSFDGQDIVILPQTEWSNKDPAGKRVLQALISSAELQQRRFYIFCRKCEQPMLFCESLRRPKLELL